MHELKYVSYYFTAGTCQTIKILYVT